MERHDTYWEHKAELYVQGLFICGIVELTIVKQIFY